MPTGTLTVEDIKTRAGLVLTDATHVRWTDAEMMLWINDGLRIMARVPAIGATTAVMPLVAGTRQRLPAQAIALVDVARNMGSNAATPGRSITEVDRAILDRSQPDWHRQRPRPEVRHFARSAATPTEFYVYPPPQLPASVEVEFTANFPTLENNTDRLPVADAFAPALVDYLLYRCFSKDADYSTNPQRAQMHYAAFSSAIGISGQPQPVQGGDA